MVAQKMVSLVIRIKKNDEVHGKRLYKLLLELLTESGISGATVWNAVDGFGKLGKSTLHVEGISMNYPLMIEIVEEREKLEPLLPQIRRMVGDHGLVTSHEVDVICS